MCPIVVMNSRRGNPNNLTRLPFLNRFVSAKLALHGGAIFTIGLMLANATFPSCPQGDLEDREFANIERLHDQGWAEKEKGNPEFGERLFRQAEVKLKEYRGKYLKDRTSIRFLRATYRLAYLSELGNRDKDARELYRDCLAHPLISSEAATFDNVAISQLATKRLAVIEGRLRQRSKSSGEDYPRISIRGGSKGEKDLPVRSSDFRP